MGILFSVCLFVFALFSCAIDCKTLNYKIRLPQAEDNALDLKVTFGGNAVLTGKLGLGSPSAVGNATYDCIPEPGHDDCYIYGDYAKLQLRSDLDGNCTRFVWTSNYARRLQDCFDLRDGVHWYGGGETNHQTWPIEGVTRGESPMVAGGEYVGLVENYWLVSSGVAVHVEEDVPLFISWNSVRDNQVCLVAEDKWPYKSRSTLELKYNICTGENLKHVHMKSIKKFYSTPTESPDPGMLLRPFWSTWAQYHVNVNQSVVLEYANRLINEGFISNSHMEIDDNWETCYGELEFDTNKFPNVSEMVQTLKSLDMKVTLWIHPFINFDCPSFQIAIENGYLVKDENGKPGLTGWWPDHESPSGYIDFTNTDAVAWWTGRIEALRTRYQIDSFKFDAGEPAYLPHSSKLNGDRNLQPNLYTTKHVETVSKFGGMVEVRTGRRNQNESIFTRMMARDWSWGYNRGLQSMIPTLLYFGIIGYPFVLPDMIGGNAYNSRPSPELFIRWIQANAFMPAVQFSLVPWDFGPQAVQASKDILALREKYADLLFKAVNEALVDGSPINRPMWWEDPEDSTTYTIDSQYMLGEDILVAPVLLEGATIRDIYLPRGQWIGFNNVEYEGPTMLTNFPAPLDTLPYFLKKSTTPALIKKLYDPTGKDTPNELNTCPRFRSVESCLFCVRIDISSL